MSDQISTAIGGLATEGYVDEKFATIEFTSATDDGTGIITLEGLVSGGTPGGSDAEVDDTLSISGASADAKIVGDAIAELNRKIADLMYEEIKITSFTNNINTVEVGSTITDITLSWGTNKAPTTLLLDGEAIDKTSTSKSFSGLSIKTDKSWTLSATDERNATVTKTTKVAFLHGVYYGVLDNIVTINNDNIAGLTKKLQNTKTITFSATANNGQYIVYALPESYGVPEFNVGGFDGGFSLHSTLNFTNSSGHSEQYSVWVSDNHSLGETTVKVS